ncbi:MAG: hypothetical protein MRQ05_02180, partial [Candidatus Midichloria mitochondrii]|nr:hypothetical protein [Candidatus Midichloria mitochondrii]
NKTRIVITSESIIPDSRSLCLCEFLKDLWYVSCRLQKSSIKQNISTRGTTFLIYREIEKNLMVTQPL